MRDIEIYQVDAFTDVLFKGNPAAVCPLTEWLTDAEMQNIALENNLAETAFVVPQAGDYFIRWFTPTVEVDLCGHATLAAAYVLFEFKGHQSQVIKFMSPRSGALTVTRQGDLLTLDFPSDTIEKIEPLDEMITGFGIAPLEAYKGKTDYLLIYETEQEIRKMIPDLSIVKQLNARGVIVTAPGEQVDFVSRFFGPQSGVDEDPVTGSAHTTLTPYWSKRLGRMQLTAKQLSTRGGQLWVEDRGDRIRISGKARMYMKGTINLQ